MSPVKSKCRACNEPYTDTDMVQCDACNKWLHYKCVGVDDTARDMPWKCFPCGGDAYPKPITTEASQTQTGLSVNQLLLDLEEQQTRETNLLDQLEAERNQREKIEQEYEAMKRLLKPQKQIDPPTTSHNKGKVDDNMSERYLKIMATKEKNNQREASLSGSSGQSRRSNESSSTSSEVKEISSTPASSDSALKELATLMKQSHVEDLPKFSGNMKDWPLFLSVFKRTTQIASIDDVTNIGRLTKALEGDARALVLDQLTYGLSPKDIIDTLKEQYGREDEVLKLLSRELMNVPKLSSPRDPNMKIFAVALKTYVAQLKALGMEAELNNNLLLATLLEKLSNATSMHGKWDDIKRADPRKNIAAFAEFVMAQWMRLPRIISVPIEEDKRSSGLGSRGRGTGRLNLHTANAADERNPTCIACEKSHSLGQCQVFKDAPVAERWEFVRRHRVCFGCLRTRDHRMTDCPHKSDCDEPGCDKSHHKLLHQKEKRSKLLSSMSLSFSGANRSVTSNHQSHDDANCSVTAKVVAVRIFGLDNRVADEYAFLDDGSSLTMMERSLAEELGIDGPKEHLSLRWTKGITRDENAIRCNVTVAGRPGGESYTLKGVYCVPNLDLAEVSQNGSVLVKRHHHLKGLPLPDFRDVKPRLLIGLEHASFLGGNKTHEGKIGEPIASKTRLGWVVYGKQKRNPDHPVPSPTQRAFVQNTHTRLKPVEDARDQELHDLVKSFFETEGIGVNQRQLRSQEDIRAEKIMKETLRYVDGRYEIGLLWKSDSEHLPDNSSMALRRLISEERKLSKDPESLQWMNQHVEQLVLKGYARVASKSELDKQWARTWICPLFTVVNHNKIPPKRRCVADVAAVQAGVSLNSCLLKGPDNLIPLPAALCRARERRVMVTADVAEMFHQVRIIEEDQQCQRFLWRDGDPTREPTIYVMQAMMFGPTCSPSTAQFVKNTHAELYRDKFPLAVEALQDSMYVDDYFSSHETREEAAKVTAQTIEICAEMGFDLVQVQSNDDSFLQLIPQRHVKPDLVNLSVEDASSHTAKLLGMFWKPAGDEFIFCRKFGELQRQMENDGYVPTKREVLSCLMRFFDPLGLATKFVVRGKWILQDIWRDRTAWDEPISESSAKDWLKFLQAFDVVEQVAIPRWYGFSDQTTIGVDLVTFVDASAKAYAAVSYFRISNGSSVQVSLVMAKSKVAPVKTMSIPRLELEAAKIGTRLAKSVGDFHSIPIRKRYFLSDSKCVLAWIQSRRFDFPPFVNHRVSEILDSSRPMEWYYVPTGENVADEATKETPHIDSGADSRWFFGPKFVKLEPPDWPVIPYARENESPEFMQVHQTAQTPFLNHCVNRIGARFRCRWVSLVKVLARMMRMVATKPKNRVSISANLTAEEMELAELELFRVAQREAFPEAWNDLTRALAEDDEAQAVTISGRGSKAIDSLPLMMQREEKIIRLASRDRTSSTSASAKRAVLLPKSHEFVYLFLQSIHEKNRHMGVESTIADARSRVWIVSIRQALRSVIGRCQLCKNRNARPARPCQGFLHESRTGFDQKPFSFVGVDCFGPIQVRERRSEVKRWGVIFTCLTFRAIHLEVVVDLSSDQIILALRRLVARRGPIVRLFSDNGTNFVGASNILATELIERQRELAHQSVAQFEVDWKFLPAYSPWMGGAWERLIGYVKKCLKFCLAGETPTDVVLANALIEAEIITNKRPLTHTPTSPDDEEPLTPNLAMFGSNQIVQGQCNQADVNPNARLNRRRVGHLAEKFRTRWEREYLPVIAKAETKAEHRPVVLGDVVLLTEGEPNRDAWKLGRVVKIHPSSDNVARIVDVKLGNGSVKTNRAVGNLAVLNVGESQSESSEPPMIATGGRMSPSQVESEEEILI